MIDWVHARRFVRCWISAATSGTPKTRPSSAGSAPQSAALTVLKLPTPERLLMQIAELPG